MRADPARLASGGRRAQRHERRSARQQRFIVRFLGAACSRKPTRRPRAPCARPSNHGRVSARLLDLDAAGASTDRRVVGGAPGVRVAAGVVAACPKQAVSARIDVEVVVPSAVAEPFPILQRTRTRRSLQASGSAYVRISTRSPRELPAFPRLTEYRTPLAWPHRCTRQRRAPEQMRGIRRAIVIRAEA